MKNQKPMIISINKYDIKVRKTPPKILGAGVHGKNKTSYKYERIKLKKQINKLLVDD